LLTAIFRPGAVSASRRESGEETRMDQGQTDCSDSPSDLPLLLYQEDADQMIYLVDRGPHVATVVDAFLTCLHSQDGSRLVGFRLKGFRGLMERMRTI
jgi:hypothetical protein